MSDPISPTADHATFSAARVRPNAAHAFGGVWRLTVRRFFTPGHWLAVLGMLVVLAMFAIGASSSQPKAELYIRWAALFYVCFLVPILVFISAGGAIRDDLKAGSVDYIFTRPVRRPAFTLFRYLSHMICAQLDYLPALGVIVAVGVFGGVPNMWSAVPLLWLGQAMVIVVFSAFGFFCGLLTSRYVILGLSYGGIVEVGLGSIPTQLNRVSMLRHVTEILNPLLGGARIGMGGPLAADPLSALSAVALLLAISAVLLALAAGLFATKELAGQSGRDA